MNDDIQVDASRVITALQRQNADLSIQVAILTARAEAAEEALKAIEGTAPRSAVDPNGTTADSA